MISVEGVYKSYLLHDGSRHLVYRDLWLQLPGQTNIGIVGRNGAGKSTLIRLLAKIDMPDRGRIISEGLISPPLGLQSGFSPILTGRDSARFVCRVRGDSADVMRQRIRYIQEFADLGEFFDRQTKTYSTGMRARLAFAISMAFDYNYYLIDELTSVGDEKFRRRADAVFRAKRGNSSIIIVSHSLETLQQWCDVGIYVRKGQVEYFDKIEKAISAYKKDNT
jgi:capsular polysaccharide transport system ATP-binding protein